MFNSSDIVGKRFALLESVVDLLKIVVEKSGLFANFPIGATIQDGGKRKRSVVLFYAPEALAKYFFKFSFFILNYS